MDPFAEHRGPSKPSIEQLTYAKTLLELALLLLAIPWVIVRLLRDPARAIRDAGEHHLR